MVDQDTATNDKSAVLADEANIKKRWKRNDKRRAYGGLGNTLPPEEKNTAYERSKKGIMKYLAENTVQFPVCFPPKTLKEFSAACRGLGITQASIVKPAMQRTIERAAQVEQGIQTEEMLTFDEQSKNTKQECLALYKNISAEFVPDTTKNGAVIDGNQPITGRSETEQFSVCLPRDLHVQFSAACKGFGVTQNSVVCSILNATVSLLAAADGAPVQMPPFEVIAKNTKDGFVEMFNANRAKEQAVNNPPPEEAGACVASQID